MSGSAAVAHAADSRHCRSTGAGASCRVDAGI